jgi:hypothetical protein
MYDPDTFGRTILMINLERTNLATMSQLNGYKFKNYIQMYVNGSAIFKLVLSFIELRYQI